MGVFIAMVATPPFWRSTAIFYAGFRITLMHVDMAMNYLELSLESQLRYQSKVVCAGLNDDPYAVEESHWTDNPDSIPTVNWSDVVLYMVSTPSPCIHP